MCVLNVSISWTSEGICKQENIFNNKNKYSWNQCLVVHLIFLKQSTKTRVVFLGMISVDRIYLIDLELKDTTDTWTTYNSGSSEFTPAFQWGSCYSIFSFICMFCRSLFVLLYLFAWSLRCLFFFDIWILIAPLVSSNSSYYRYE